MGTVSLWRADCFEESVKYIFVDFLGGFENAMTTVADELRGFGERGMPPYGVAAITNYKLDCSSSAISCR